MAIQYPVDVEATRGRWWLLDTETNEVAKMSGGSGDWPNGDGGEIAGLAANLVPLLKVDGERPTEIDERLVRLESETEPPDIEANEIRTKWNVKDRSKAEKRDVVLNIENEEANRHIDVRRELLETRMVVASLLRSVKNLNVPAPLKELADRYQNKAEKIYRNRLKIAAMLAAVEADQDPVLDQEFEPEE